MLEHCSRRVKLVGVTTNPLRSERRADALSKERIVEVAIEILDADGEDALTFRALAARLATGSGAIYWHVTNKGELLAAATDVVIARAMAEVVERAPLQTIRAIAAGVFDAVDAHPWVGTQLSREPWQPAMVQILEGIGRQVQAHGVTEAAQFNSATALLGFIVGLAAQYAAGARLRTGATDRSAFLTAVAARWRQHDPTRFPFVHQVAAQLPHHDDREQFLAGVDLFLAGIDATR